MHEFSAFEKRDVKTDQQTLREITPATLACPFGIGPCVGVAMGFRP
jgi:hypothetical protein